MIRVWGVALLLTPVGCVRALDDVGFEVETGFGPIDETEELTGCLTVSPTGVLSFTEAALQHRVRVESDCTDVPVEYVIDDPNSAFDVEEGGLGVVSPGQPREATVTLTRRDGQRHEAQLQVRINIDGQTAVAGAVELTGQAVP